VSFFKDFVDYFTSTDNHQLQLLLECHICFVFILSLFVLVLFSLQRNFQTQVYVTINKIEHCFQASFLKMVLFFYEKVKDFSSIFSKYFFDFLTVFSSENQDFFFPSK